MVADRNGRDHDLAASRCDAHGPRNGYAAAAGNYFGYRYESGKPVGVNEGGYLVIKYPWPSMLRTLWGDDERYKQDYWSEIPGFYFAGDGARRDEHGYYWIMGRVDDVINVSGHRLGTAEVESALVSHEAVAEAAVVGRPDDLKGRRSLRLSRSKARKGSEELKEELRATSRKRLALLPNPMTYALRMLPKTRSGKIMRRLLRELATSGMSPAM